VAEIVGRQLRALAARRQVLCVTTCPRWPRRPISTAGGEADPGPKHHHPIEPLDKKSQVEELARMLAGSRSRDHAQTCAGDDFQSWELGLT